MNKKLLIIFILIILIVVGHFAYKNYYAPKVVAVTFSETLSCNDSGEPDVYIKSSVLAESEGQAEAGVSEWFDECTQHPEYGTVLRESWCEGLTYKTRHITCGYGHSCNDGACVKN